MKKLIPVLLVGLLGVGCDDLEGTIQVQAPLVLKTKKETLTLPQGSHHAEFDVDSDDREIEIKVKDAKGKEKKAIVRYPFGTVIPESSGTFSVKSTDSGQAFDLNGAIDTNVDVGPSQYGQESCTLTVQVERFRLVPIYDRTGKIVGQRRERYFEYVTVNGRREVRYHNKSTTVTGRAEFLEPQNGSLIATFNGRRAWAETIYEYQGICYR